MSAFTFDGVSSTTFNAVVFEKSLYETPAKQYNLTPIPGRNGNILLSQHRFEDVTMSYIVLFTSNFDTNYSALRNYLLSRDGYCRLTDTFNTGEYYLAYYSDVMQPIITRDHDMGKVTIRFQRRAERFLTSGETTQTFMFNSSETSHTITNPTTLPARPLIYLSTYQTTGVVTTVGDKRFTTKSFSSGLYIDCEVMECYSYNSGQAVDMNDRFILLDDALDFPKLLPGENTISYSEVTSGNARILITPRWWKL